MFALHGRYEDKEYALVKHLDPVFVISRQTKNGYYLLGEAEAEAVRNDGEISSNFLNFREKNSRTIDGGAVGYFLLLPE